MLNGLRRPQKIMFLFSIIIFFSIVFILLLSTSMQMGFIRDENQFVASGALLANELLFPYEDYPYFHMPNLVFVYAIIFKFTNHILLAARIFSVVCATLSLGLIFYIALNLFGRHNYSTRFLIAAGSVVFILMNPVFQDTSVMAWNHNLSLLLTLIAFVFYSHGMNKEWMRKWVFFSGIFLGLAVGIRLSFAPAVIPFITIIFLYPNVTPLKKKIYLVLWFSFGFFLSMLPSILMFASAPKQFVFGNFFYPRLNTMYRQETGYEIAMTLDGKLIYFIELIGEPRNLLLSLLFLFFSFLWIVIKPNQKRPNYFNIIFILILIPSLLIGSFAPTPSWSMYFHPLIPFLMIGVLYEIASFYDQDERIKWSLRLLTLTIFISSIYWLQDYKGIDNLLSPDEWIPIRVHKTGVEIAAEVGEGDVLTLSSIVPLEGGVNIYEEFATGAFAWRTAHFLPRDRRIALGMVSEDDLEDFLRAKPPKAILVGLEGELEKPLVEYAKRNGYKPQKLSEGTLWLSPGV